MDASTLRIEWSPPPLLLHNGVIVDYMVNISEIETGITLQFATGGELGVTIPGLHPFYSYSYVITALTVVGHGPHSSSVSVRMPEDGELKNKMRILSGACSKKIIII